MKSMLLTVCAFVFVLLVGVSFGAEVPFNQAQFDAVKATGKPVAVVFHADWCPTCRAQAPVLQELSQTAEFQPLTVFIADFDAEKSLKQSLHVVKQSTVVVFTHGQEGGRSIGETRREELAALLRSAIG